MPSAAQVIRDWADPEAIAMKTVRAAVRPDFVDDSRNVQCLGLLAYARSVLVTRIENSPRSRTLFDFPSLLAVVCGQFPFQGRTLIDSQKECRMERQILHWSYWLGLACLIIAVVWRVANVFGLALSNSIFPLTFYKGSLLLLVAAIASASYASFKSQKP